MQNAPRRHRTYISSSRGVARLGVLLALGFCALVAVMLIQLRRDAWISAQRGAQNVLGTVSNDIARTIELYDLSLQGVIDGLNVAGLSNVTPEMRQAILFDRATTARYLGSILVLNAAGTVVDHGGTAGIPVGSLAKQEYFTAHRNDPDPGLFISAPAPNPANPDQGLVIALSRRISRPDGTFGGVVVGMLRMKYFRDLFDTLELGKRGSVGLFRADGTLMARNPYDESKIGRSIRGSPGMQAMATATSGTFASTATLDGISRISTFTRIGTLPLMLAVNFSEADVYADWNSRAAVIGSVLVTLCLAMGGLGVMLARELLRRAKAERELRASEAQYRLLADHATDIIARLGPGLAYRYASPSCRSMLGCEPTAVRGTSVADRIHPDDRDRVLAVIKAAQHHGQPTAVVYRMMHAGGVPLWVEGHYSYMPSDGGFSVIIRDIAARKQTEEALELANAELTRMAATDPLTGLANRRRLDEALQSEWRRAARDQQPLTLLMLDVDRFKLFNDRYGHQAGDKCLQLIAQAVASCAARGGDIVARYGGEELAVLLPETDPPKAMLAAERVRKVIIDLALQHEANTAHAGIVTASIGVATAYPQALGFAGDPPYLPEASGRETPADLIAAADRMLYEAKRQGRNRVASAPILETVALPRAQSAALVQ